MASLLFGVQAVDPATIALVIATMMAVAATASWLPAWRPSRVDPELRATGRVSAGGRPLEVTRRATLG
ncbi:MAG: hypothetical protein QM757_00750 [Paludibaculum sp.]